MPPVPDPRELDQLATKARSVELRLRVDAGFRAWVRGLPFCGVYALGALTWIKVAQPGVLTEQRLLGGLVALFTASLAVGAFRFFERRPERFGAQALDRHHGFADRITSALSFRAVPAAERTPLMEAAILDALSVAKDAKPSQAAPLRLPGELGVVALLAGSVWGLSLLEVRRTEVIPAPVSEFEAMTLGAEDEALLREVAEQLAEDTTDPEVRAAVQGFNQLVEDIAERRVDRRDVFRRLEAMESALIKGLDTEAESLDEGLRGIARELDKSGMTRPVAEALNEKRLEDAEKALRELAEKLKQKKKPANKAELEKLRQALDAASKASKGRLDRIAEQRRELEEQKKRLLSKKKQNPREAKQDAEELKRTERQLERLQRNQHKAERSAQKMSELDKELAKAAAELLKDMGASAESLERGAQDINRAAKQEMTNEEKRALKRRLEEMRELLRQQGKEGKDRAQRMLDFGRRARGGKPGKGGKPGQGQGKGKPSGPPRLVLSPGGGGIPVELPGGGSDGAPGQSGTPGEGSGRGGQEWGTGSGGDPRGEATDLGGQIQDVSAAGIDSGQGVSASEVVYGAAERGFTGKGYRKIFTEYETVAEETLNRDEIPPGYEFYVRRYFQLIRPRE